MSVIIQGDQLRALLLGVRVKKGPVTNPQGASTSLFTVSGQVIITSLTGRVTTVQGGTTNNFNVTHTPTGGSAGDLCAATVCTSDAVGTFYSVQGVTAGLLSQQTEAGTEVPNVTSVPIPPASFLVDSGSIKLKASGSNTGATSWTLTYIPLDDGASVVAA